MRVGDDVLRMAAVGAAGLEIGGDEEADLALAVDVVADWFTLAAIENKPLT